MKKTIPHWTPQEKKIFDTLTSPKKIQNFLDSLKYNSKWKTGSPREVIKYKRAHCFDGALFAAAALRNLGYKPLIMDLGAFGDLDDDHVLAVYKKNGFWGCVSKSNFSILRWRDPVYRSLRELAMSFFDFYFNAAGVKSLKEYSLPLNLEKFDKYEWMTTEGDVDFLADHLANVRHFDVMDEKTVRALPKVSGLLIEVGLLGSAPEGLFKV